jgi:hypothetical protein
MGQLEASARRLASVVSTGVCDHAKKGPVALARTGMKPSTNQSSPPTPAAQAARMATRPVRRRLPDTLG